MARQIRKRKTAVGAAAYEKQRPQKIIPGCVSSHYGKTAKYGDGSKFGDGHVFA